MFVGMVACKGATRTELAAVQAKPWSAASSRRFDTSRSDDEHGKPSAIAAL